MESPTISRLNPLVCNRRAILVLAWRKLSPPSGCKGGNSRASSFALQHRWRRCVVFPCNQARAGQQPANDVFSTLTSPVLVISSLRRELNQFESLCQLTYDSMTLIVVAPNAMTLQTALRPALSRGLFHQSICTEKSTAAFKGLSSPATVASVSLSRSCPALDILVLEQWMDDSSRALRRAGRSAKRGRELELGMAVAERRR